MALKRMLAKAAKEVGSSYKKGWSEFGRSAKELVTNPKKAVGEYISSGQAKKDITKNAMGAVGATKAVKLSPILKSKIRQLTYRVSDAIANGDYMGASIAAEAIQALKSGKNISKAFQFKTLPKKK